MIVLKRKRGQSVRIGRAIVTILGTGFVTVRLGIEAPPEVGIDWRSEQADSPVIDATTVEARPPVMLARPEAMARMRSRSLRDRTPPTAGWLAV